MALSPHIYVIYPYITKKARFG